MESFLTRLMADDSPLTLAGLAYIVYKLHVNDTKQTKAIKWLKATLSGILIRIENLERFNQRKYPQEWRAPNNPPNVSLHDTTNFDDEL